MLTMTAGTARALSLRETTNRVTEPLQAVCSQSLNFQRLLRSQHLGSLLHRQPARHPRRRLVKPSQARLIVPTAAQTISDANSITALTANQSSCGRDAARY